MEICNIENDIVTKLSPCLDSEEKKKPELINTAHPNFKEKRCTKRTVKPTEKYEMYKISQQKTKCCSKIKNQTHNEISLSANVNKTIINNSELVQNIICGIKVDATLLAEDLKPERLLSDDVVDAFLLINADIAKKQCNKRILVIPSIFYRRINQETSVFSPGWINSVDDALNYDLILLPIHTKEPDHWTLVLVDMKNKKITLLDSTWKEDISFASAIIKNICDLLQFANTEISGDDFQWGAWSHYYPTDILRQNNRFDCGVRMHVGLHDLQWT
jgi:hypothetical protein